MNIMNARTYNTYVTKNNDLLVKIDEYTIHRYDLDQKDQREVNVYHTGDLESVIKELNAKVN